MIYKCCQACDEEYAELKKPDWVDDDSMPAEETMRRFEALDHPIVPPTKTGRQILKEHVEKIKPYVPYAILAWGFKTRSTNTLIGAIFALLAVKRFNKSTVISNCSISGAGTGMVIR